MTPGHDESAENDRKPPPEPSIRYETTEHRREVDQSSIGTVDPGGVLLSDRQVFGHVEDQQRAHSVERELLPHLGEK